MKDGGPAYPIRNQHNVVNHLGMSLLDYFAGQALAGMLAWNPTESQQRLGMTPWASMPRDQIAAVAYERAEAMLDERERRTTENAT